MKRGIWLVIGPALLLAPSLSARAEQAQGPPSKAEAAKAAEQRGGRLAAFIQAVGSAEHPRQAISAYARGCAVDRSKPEIHEAYMRRMLQFGLPRIAYYPARVLVTMQRDNGVAWGVLGYMHGRRGELDEALSATVRAAENDGGNPSILHNAGQLVAWYDNELNLPKISDRTKRSLEKVRRELSERQPFARAYKGMTAAYKEQAALAEGFARKIDALEAETLALERLALDVDRKIRDFNDEIAYREDVIDSLRRDLYYASWAYYPSAHGGYVVYPAYEGPYRRETRRRIRDQQHEIEKLQLDIRTLRREGHGVLGDLRAKRGRLDKLRDQTNQALARVRRRFRWDPPAVDGVVTDETEHFGPPPARDEPENAETAAEKRLDMAGLYLRHDLRERAVEILRQVAKTHGSTKAAARARLLLRELKRTE